MILIMKKNVLLMPLMVLVVMMSLVCSCGNLVKKITGTPDDPYVGKTYKGTGNGGGLSTEMAITFLENNKCVCTSDWYGAYSTNKEIEGTQEVKQKQVVVRCKDGDVDYVLEFDVSDDGRTIGFDHSDPSMGGTMGMDIMSLELQGEKIKAAESPKSKDDVDKKSIERDLKMFLGEYVNSINDNIDEYLSPDFRNVIKRWNTNSQLGEFNLFGLNSSADIDKYAILSLSDVVDNRVSAHVKLSIENEEDYYEDEVNIYLVFDGERWLVDEIGEVKQNMKFSLKENNVE